MLNGHISSNFRMKVSNLKNIFRCFSLNSKFLKQVTQKDSLKSPLDYYYRNILPEDIPKIIEIRRNLRSHDCYSCLQTWSQLNPEGIVIAEGQGGKIAATGAFVQNSDQVFACGLMYVDPQFRHTGMAREILQLGIEITQNKITYGSSVESMVRVYYDAVGCIPIDNYTVLRNVTSKDIHFELLFEELPPGVALQPFTSDYFFSINEYDSNLMGYDRGPMLKLSCQEENSRTFVALDGRKCVGYGSVKLSCLGAVRVGPLYADDSRIAEALLKTLLKSFPRGKGFIMMTLSNNDNANSLMTKLAVPTTQRLVQMFRIRPLEVETEKIYAHFDVNFCAF